MTGLAIALLVICAFVTTDQFGLQPPWSLVAGVAVGWLSMSLGRAIDRMGKA